MTIHKAPRPKKVVNPLIAGIEAFLSLHLSCLPPSEHGNGPSVNDTDGKLPPPENDLAPIRNALQSSDLPKRYTLYEPMLLLGTSFPSHTPAWEHIYSTLTSSQLQELYRSIADAFCKSGHYVSHVALNAPIQSSVETENSGQQDNIMRSPVNLQPLFGDFGPATYSSNSRLTSTDLDAAFWVETSQVSGIKQVWAPRWTMFSRGNIREKGRILGQQGVFPGLTTEELGQQLMHVDVVDFYVGIGYFAFSYLKRGARTVFGWDLNQWSIEGLRRGCAKNGWHCLVITVDDAMDQRMLVSKQVIEALLGPSPPRCVAFCGNNNFASEVMLSISAGLKNTEHELKIRHANLGLLPTSQGAWSSSASILDHERGGWLHVHENAEIARVHDKEQEVLGGLRDALGTSTKQAWEVSCQNIEMVKTYAPGVGHYVFDIKLWPSR